MFQLRGIIDDNDLIYSSKQRGGEIPIAAEPCPLKKGKIHPTTSRFYWKNGDITDLVHIKPIYYLNTDRKWRPLGEVASYFGNKRGLVLRPGWEEKIHPGYITWYLKRLKILKSNWGIRLEYPIMWDLKHTDYLYHPLVLNLVTDFLPDPNPETTSVDGDVRYDNAGTWSGARDAATGTSATDSDLDFESTAIQVAGGFYVYRDFLLFDTSSLDDTASKSATTIALTRDSVVGTPGTNDMVFTASTPASNTALVTADFDALTLNTPTEFNTRVTYNTWTADGNRQTVTLNSDGIANISLTGISKFAIRNGNKDVDNVSPAEDNWDMRWKSADTAGTTNDPVASVTYTVPAAAGMSLMSLLGIG